MTLKVRRGRADCCRGSDRSPFQSRQRRLIAFLPLGVALTAGCQRESVALPPPAEASVAVQPAVLRDEDIAEAVRRTISEDAFLRGQGIHVAVVQGVASLSGSVTNLVARDRAGRVAGTIRGVRSVVNQVVVAPSSHTDVEIERNVSRELRSDLGTNRHAVSVAVKDGVVTLSGKADSWPEKTLMGVVARSVAGVRELNNAIVVMYSLTRPAGEIADEVRQRIANDVWLDGTFLTVTASGQTVHVTGVVGSYGQQVQAEADALVTGVNDVDDTGVVVDWNARDQQRVVTSFPFRPDTEVAQAIRDAFRYDPRLKALEPKVIVDNGNAVLSGTVDSPRARRAAEADARNAIGVWQVYDRVVVQPAATPTDADVDREASRVIAEDLVLPDRQAIRVSTSKGKLALSGTVTSGVERDDAVDDVASLPGVIEVEDQLAVRRPPEEIKTAIEDALLWDAMLERDRVRVTVDPGGVATLTGTLDSWAEIKAASDDALRSGASHVINLLQFKNHPEFVAH